VSSLSEVRDYLLDAESTLRELATEIQLRGSPENIDKYREKIFDAYDMMNSAVKIAEEVSEPAPVLEELRKSLEKAKEIAWRIYDELEYAYEPNPDIDSYIEKDLDELENYVMKLTGERCRFRAPPTQKLVSKLNDLASCIHRIAEKILGAVRRIGRCDITENANSVAIKACTTWSVATDVLTSKGLYNEHDIPALWGYVAGDRVYLRVGSAPGHRTVIDLGEGKVEYYDTDNEVNEAVKRLLEKIGLRCERHVDGVTCIGVNQSNAQSVAKILAFTTSMDIRMKNPAPYWGEEAIVENETRLVEKMLKEIEPYIESKLNEWKI